MGFWALHTLNPEPRLKTSVREAIRGRGFRIALSRGFGDNLLLSYEGNRHESA